MHHNFLELVAKGELYLPVFIRAHAERTKRQKDIKGQTFFGFLKEHWAGSKGQKGSD
jgi:hypothetical protein